MSFVKFVLLCVCVIREVCIACVRVCVAVCCRVADLLKCVLLCVSVLCEGCIAVRVHALQSVAECCSVL